MEGLLRFSTEKSLPGTVRRVDLDVDKLTLQQLKKCRSFLVLYCILHTLTVVVEAQGRGGFISQTPKDRQSLSLSLCHSLDNHFFVSELGTCSDTAALHRCLPVCDRTLPDEQRRRPLVLGASPDE